MAATEPDQCVAVVASVRKNTFSGVAVVTVLIVPVNKTCFEPGWTSSLLVDAVVALWPILASVLAIRLCRSLDTERVSNEILPKEPIQVDRAGVQVNCPVVLSVMLTPAADKIKSFSFRTSTLSFW